VRRSRAISTGMGQPAVHGFMCLDRGSGPPSTFQSSMAGGRGGRRGKTAALAGECGRGQHLGGADMGNWLIRVGGTWRGHEWRGHECLLLRVRPPREGGATGGGRRGPTVQKRRLQQAARRTLCAVRRTSCASCQEAGQQSSEKPAASLSGAAGAARSRGTACMGWLPGNAYSKACGGRCLVAVAATKQRDWDKGWRFTLLWAKCAGAMPRNKSPARSKNPAMHGTEGHVGRGTHPLLVWLPKVGSCAGRGAGGQGYAQRRPRASG
jgi:hypothetical protein